jgi:hypothetical protein
MGLGVVALGAFAAFHTVVFMGLSIFTAVTSLTVPAVMETFLAFSGSTTLSVSSCLLLAAEGVLGGLAFGLMKRYLHLKNNFGKSVFAELVVLQKRDAAVVLSIMLNLLVGAVVGWIAGAGGTHGLLQTIFMNRAIDPGSIIGGLIAGGGAGGVGGGNTLLLFLFIVLIFVVQGIIVGAGAGLTFGMLSGAVTGAIKGGTFESVFSLTGKEEKVSRARVFGKSALKGVVEGALVGGIVGFIQGIITAIVAVRNKND